MRYKLTSVPIAQYNSSIRQLNVANAHIATLTAERSRHKERIRELEEGLRPLAMTWMSDQEFADAKATVSILETGATIEDIETARALLGGNNV